MDDIKKVIYFSGYLGLLQGIQRFLMPIILLSYNWNLKEYALVFLFQALSMSIPFIFSGFISDLKGRRQTVGIGFIFFSTGVLYLVYSISGGSIIPIIIAQMLVTLSSGFGRVGLSTLMVDLTRSGQNRTENMGKSAGLQNLSSFIGPVIIGFLVSGFSMKNITYSIEFSIFGYPSLESGFLLVALLGLFGISSTFLLPKTPEINLIQARKASITDISPEQRKMQSAFLMQEILIGLTSGMIVPFINYYILITFEPSEFIWGLVFGLSNSIIAIGSVIVGRYGEKYGKRNTVLALNIMAPILALGIALAGNFFWISIFYILRSGFANTTHPVWQSWYFEYTMSSARGRTFSIVQVSRRIARASGVAVGPLLYASIGVMSFPLACLFYPISMTIPFFTEKKLDKKLIITTG